VAQARFMLGRWNLSSLRAARLGGWWPPRDEEGDALVVNESGMSTLPVPSNAPEQVVE
jgi:hypothetical protein